MCLPRRGGEEEEKKDEEEEEEEKEEEGSHNYQHAGGMLMQLSFIFYSWQQCSFLATRLAFPRSLPHSFSSPCS
eukprot:377203-Pyramimonas_sp.AAC.1